MMAGAHDPDAVGATSMSDDEQGTCWAARAEKRSGTDPKPTRPRTPSTARLSQPDHLAAHGDRDLRGHRAGALHRGDPDRPLRPGRHRDDAVHPLLPPGLLRRGRGTPSPRRTPRWSRARSAAANALSITVERAAPLICAGLGVSLAFRAGLFNIGAPGPADHRRPASRATSASAGPCPAGAAPPGRVRRRPPRRRDLGRHRRHPQGADRGARGDHHDHAQLPGRVGAALRAVQGGLPASRQRQPALAAGRRVGALRPALRHPLRRDPRVRRRGGRVVAARAQHASASSCARSGSTPTPRAPRA